MQQFSEEVHLMLHGRGLGFSVSQWLHVFLSNDSGFAEILLGALGLGLRGIVLLTLGFAYDDVAQVLADFGLTHTAVGGTLLVLGLAQITAPGTRYYGLRAAVAFVGAAVTLLIVVTYLGVDRAHTSIAWAWAGLMASEALLTWRILLSRLVAPTTGRDA